MQRRFHLLRRIAETEEWRQYIPAEALITCRKTA
jgi:hypothetical protein